MKEFFKNMKKYGVYISINIKEHVFLFIDGVKI
jgi:hypothetical protein